MIDPKKIEQIARQVHESMPKGLRDLGEDVEKKIRQVLQSQLTRLDLVSREEFDVQTQVLLRTREKLALLEQRLNDLENRSPNQLSGGQQQRVAIARSLCMNPQVMLFDEVTAALDPEMVQEVLEVIRDLAGSGMTLLIVTHELAFARAVADRIVFMEKGQILEQGSPHQFFDNPRSQRARQFLAKFSYTNVIKRKESA